MQRVPPIAGNSWRCGRDACGSITTAALKNQPLRLRHPHRSDSSSTLTRGFVVDKVYSQRLEFSSSRLPTNPCKNRSRRTFYCTAVVTTSVVIVGISVSSRQYREEKIQRELPLATEKLRIVQKAIDKNSSSQVFKTYVSSKNRSGSKRDLTELRQTIQRTGLMGQTHRSVKAELEDIRKWHVSIELILQCAAKFVHLS